jgi:DNA-directed RNA polymerase sigma subunit (sigma70/sigma32)
MMVALGCGMHVLGMHMGDQNLKRTPEALGLEEELVLLLRFGRTPGRSRGEVALLIGRSPSAVRRIECRALRKLRQIALGPVSHGWAGWDEV